MLARRRTAAVLLAIPLTVVPLTACGGGSPSPPATPGTTSSDGPTASSPSAAPAGSPTGEADATSGAPTPVPLTVSPAASPAGPSAGATDLGYRVSYRRTTAKVGAAKLESVYPEVTVTGGPDDATRAAVRQLLAGRISAARTAFTDVANLPDATDTPPDAAPSQQEVDVLHESRWGPLYAVEFSEYSYSSGAAHPVTNLFAVTVDWRTGRAVTVRDLYSDLRPVDRAVHAALVAKGIDATGAASITVGPETGGGTAVDSALTPAGLWVGVSHCILTCAYGPIEVTVPWSRLPTPKPGLLSNQAS